MSNQHDPGSARPSPGHRDRLIVSALIVALFGTAICFRLLHLSSMPGVSGDEGWWGAQANAWLSGRPYEAHTTSGNPIDLFFLVPVALVHELASPSFFVLRAVPALVNLLALPVAFWFVRRLYGATTAWIHTVALAILPTAIAHSRICQDPSQTIFWTGIVIYLSLLGLKERSRTWVYLGTALVVFPIALWTHPTNVFIAPFLALPCVGAARHMLPASRAGRAILIVVTTSLVAIGLFAAGFALPHLAASHEYLDQPWLSIASARMADGTQWLEFAANNVRLFNGVTIYHYFSGARPATFPHDAGFVVVAGAAFWGFLLTSAARHRALDYGLIFACVTMWIGFYAFAGPQALRPHADRWGLCLIVPAILVLARGLAGWIEWRPRTRWLTIAAATLVATSLLTSFYVNYFGEFATTGGRSHLTYVTAPTEPKQQALDLILARSGGSDRVTIITQQWWLFWPIAYLALEHPNVSVSMGLQAERQPDLQETARNGRLYFVEFVGTPQLGTTIDWIRARGLHAASTTIQDAGGRDHLEVLQVTAAR
jgi:hypothetical protein